MKKSMIFPLLTAVIGTIISLIVFNELPSQIAIHFSRVGTPDNWLAKPLGAFMLPVLSLVIPLFTILSVKLEKDDNKKRRAEAQLVPTVAIISALLLSVHMYILLYNLGYTLEIGFFATILVGLLFISLGNLVPRMPQGTFKWPKLPEDKHRKISRFQGRLMLVFGFVFLLLALLPNSWILPTFFPILVTFIATTFISAFYYARKG